MRPLATYLSLALFASLSGCLSDAALDYDRLHVSVVRADGTPAQISPADGCFELPVLLGSRVKTSMRVDATFDIALDATRDRVRLSIDSTPSIARSFRSEDLSSSGVIDSFAVQMPNGATFQVELSGACPGEPVAEGS